MRVQHGWIAMALGALALALMTTGCKQGAGLSSLFGGSGGSGSSSFFSGDGSGEIILSSGSGRVFDVSPATVNNPEPASIALFGGGLAGLAVWRRRKARKAS